LAGRAADGLRAEALLEPVPDASGVRWDETGEIDRIRAFNDTIHYVLPKLLLIATVLHKREFEPAPDGSAAEPRADPSRIPAGAAEGTTKVEMVEPEKADERVRTIFESVRERHQHRWSRLTTVGSATGPTSWMPPGSGFGRSSAPTHTRRARAC